MKKIILVIAIILIGAGVLYRHNSKEAASIGIIRGADGPTAYFTTKNKKTDKDKDKDKDEGVEIIGGADGPTQIYTKK